MGIEITHNHYVGFLRDFGVYLVEEEERVGHSLRYELRSGGRYTVMIYRSLGWQMALLLCMSLDSWSWTNRTWLCWGQCGQTRGRIYLQNGIGVGGLFYGLVRSADTLAFGRPVRWKRGLR